MQLTQKSLLIFLAFLFAISLAGNVYSFSKGNGENEEAESQLTQYENKLVEKEETISSLQKELDTKEIASPVETEEVEQAAPETETAPTELINTAQRFVEYAFETDSETYVARKKLAQNYMTEGLYETLYASDGVASEQQEIAVNINEVTVFPDAHDEQGAIVFYTYEEEILSSGYKKQKERYVKLFFTGEGSQLKVAAIEPLENDYGGI